MAVVDGAPTLPRRRPVVLAATVGAALIAAAYGHFALGMRFGPPLVMVALGGMTLALSAAALWRVIDPLTRGETALVAELRAPHRIRELEREKQAVLKAIKEIELDHQMRKISTTDYREMVERYRTRALRVMGDLATGDDVRALIERELKHRMAARAAAADTDPQTDDSDNGGPTSARAADDSTGASTTAAARDDGAASATRSACGACGVGNDADAQFCKQCGHKLVASAPKT